MKSFAYFIMRHGVKLVGVSIHGDSMEDAARGLLRRNEVTAVANTMEPPMYDFFRNGDKVSVALWLSPEQFAEANNPKDT